MNRYENLPFVQTENPGIGKHACATWQCIAQDSLVSANPANSHHRKKQIDLKSSLTGYNCFRVRCIFDLCFTVCLCALPNRIYSTDQRYRSETDRTDDIKCPPSSHPTEMHTFVYTFFGIIKPNNCSRFLYVTTEKFLK